MRILFVLLFLLAHLLLLCALAADEDVVGEEDARYFERKIRPILAERCYSCHSSQAKVLHGGLHLDSRQALQQGGDSGPTVIAGDPDESLLIQVIRYGGDMQMPPKGKLPDSEIHELTEWVKRGAFYPGNAVEHHPQVQKVDIQEGRKFWSFQPVCEQPLPEVRNTGWPKTRLDHFVLSELERQSLAPAPPADATTVIRRLSFDLTGLPPSPESVQAYVADPSPLAIERLLDDLLSSPRYGEKWARVWLDLARYSDQTESWLLQEGQAHFYRDWVVNALNQDMPYDEFVRQQLAVDLIAGSSPEDLAALGFVGLSPTYWKELQLPCEVIKVIVADEWEERVDAVCSTFLGLTVACARCHDHKFDPISSADFYAIAGVFASSRQVGRPLVAEELYAPVRTAKEEVAKLEPELTKLKAEIEKRQVEKSKQEKLAESTTAPSSEGNWSIAASSSSDELRALQVKLDDLTSKIAQLKATPLYDAPLVNALSEESLFVERAGDKPENGTKLVYRPGPQDLPLFTRGDPNRPGEIVPRGFLKVLAQGSDSFQSGSGRLELAKAITSDAASLAARVIVNRVWLAHFGQGIVSTPSNFGSQGARPTHPELLEDLSARFISHGWSLKWLHREILLSATWQQSVQATEKANERDPSNRWLSHFNRRRHDFEAWRDAILVASDSLDLTVGGVAANLDEKENRRRTLYCMVHRRELSTTFQIHDFPDPNQHSPHRFCTTTPLQGLYALNGPLLLEQSQLLHARLELEYPDDEVARLDRAHWLLFSRPATASQQQLGLEYLAEATGMKRAERWIQYLHALVVSNEMLFLD